jgi:hypothetical protein
MEKVKIQSFHTYLYIDFWMTRLRSSPLVIFGFCSNVNVVLALLQC